MGIKGLTTLLRKRGILPQNDRNLTNIENDSTFNFRAEIRSNSTLAIDGSSFAFYVFRLAYHKHYGDMKKRKNDFNDTVHFISSCLPSMVPLSLIQSITDEFLHQLIFKYKVHVHIYLDGSQRCMKEYKDQSRKQQRIIEERNLRLFCLKEILPSSSLERSNGNRIKNIKIVNHSGSFQIPEANVLLNSFPMPGLWFDQVMHSFRLMEHEINYGKLKVKSKTTFRVINCSGEADQSVAKISAMDSSNQTFAVGLDSDYLLYGFPRNHDVWKIGDMSVQYIPLDSMEVTINETKDNTSSSSPSLKAIVLTRQDVANIFQMHYDLLLEASIVMGNDYTAKFDFKTLNFYHDCCDKHYRKMEEIVGCFIEADPSYRIKSHDMEYQLAIEFTRDLFGFENIEKYPVDNENNIFGDNKSEDDIQIFIEKNVDYKLAVVAVNEMMEDDHSRETLHTQIMAPFQYAAFMEHSPTKEKYLLMEEALQLMNNSSIRNSTLPYRLDWKIELIAHQLQKSIATTLKARRKNDIIPTLESSPTRIFDITAFYQIVERLYSKVNYIYNNYDNAVCMRNNNSNDNDFKVKKSKGSMSLVPSKLVQVNKVSDPPLDKQSKKEKNNKNQHSSGVHEQLKTLPIDEFKDVILQNIQRNRVTVIQGETGCGKSSRVPVMLIEAPPPDPEMKRVKMFICQPRRIAAKSLTERVRDTEPHLKDCFGLRMGHGIREYETKKTCAWFCTTGYLVRLLAGNPEAFDDCSHLIIDEVHERSVDTDVLCLLARRLLWSHPNIRLILMSATVAAELYCAYFDVKQPPIFVGRRCFPIHQYFIENIANCCKFGAKEQNQIQEVYRTCMKIKCQTTPNAYIMGILHYLSVQIAIAVGDDKSAVLIFVPGMADIVTIMDMFNEIPCVGKKFLCIPIHSDIPFDEQLVAFQRPEKGQIKIIIATNAAESSITLPDVDHVICTGLCKQIVYNSSSHRQMLESSWISKASATQRSGRTGRVREGNVYRLYPRIIYERYMVPFEISEILRMPLDSVILNMRKIVQDESVTELLSQCLEPPETTNIERSFSSLHKSGFIDDPVDDFEITPLGSLAVNLGIDLTFAAFVGMGLQLGVGAEAIEIANILSFPKSPWLIPNSLLQGPQKFNEIASNSYRSMAFFDGELYSEPLAIMNLLYDWERSNKKNIFCKKNFVSYLRLQRLKATSNNLRARVAETLKRKIDDLRVKCPPREMSFEKVNILRFIHAWLFHENIVTMQTDRKLSKTSEGFVFMNLSGGIVKESHLHQLLDKSRHPFSLDTKQNAIINGYVKPLTDVNGQFRSLDLAKFEERLISLAKANNLTHIICSYPNSNITIYYPMGYRANIKSCIGRDVDSHQTILCRRNIESNMRGWKGRDCGAYSIEYNEFFNASLSTDPGITILEKFSILLPSKKIRKEFNDIRRSIQEEYAKGTMCSLCVRVDKQCEHQAPTSWDIYTYGLSNITSQDIKDLFASPFVDLHNRNDYFTQQIIFKEASHAGPTDCIMIQSGPILTNAPEGMRILSSVASGDRKKNQIYFHQASDDNKGEDSIQISLNEKSISHRWKQYPSGGQTLVNEISYPASITPVDKVEIFACGANSLLLKGGSKRVEGITLLPFGEIFVHIVKKCMGEDCTQINLGYHLENLVRRFHNEFSRQNEKFTVRENAVNILSKIFKELNQNSHLGNNNIQGTNVNISHQINNAIGNQLYLSHQPQPTSEYHTKQKSRNLEKGKNRYQCLTCGARPYKLKQLKEHLSICHNEIVINRKDYLITF